MAWRSWRGHSIGHNKGTRRPSLFCFVDTETRRLDKSPWSSYSENELRLGSACFVEWRRNRQPQEIWWDFHDAESFWLRLCGMLETRRVVWVVAHNALFDATILRMWERIESGYFTTTDLRPAAGSGAKVDDGNGKLWQGLIAIDSLPFHLELKHQGKRLNITDLMNYYPVALESLGEMTGVAKMPMPDNNDPDDKWLAYCRNDVEILKRAYLGLVGRWASEDNGNWKMSAASLAWNCFRHKRDCSDIIAHQHAEAKDLEKCALYGGECRAWYRGICPAPVVHLDVNSLYPSVMANNLYPVELLDYILTPHMGIVESLMRRYAVIADVTMENLCDDIPSRSAGKVVYGVGAFRTQLAGPELAACLRGGCVSTIHRIAYYETSDIFTDYVQRWWRCKADARANGQVADEQFCKLMLVGLQGKFSQRTRSWQSDETLPAIRPWSCYPHVDPKTNCVRLIRTIGWNAQVARNRGDCQHSFFAVAAYITSYARQRMQLLRKDIPPLSLYYQDTDSLMVDRQWFNSEGIRLLPIGDELGQLRIVGEYKQLVIRGPKNYTADGRHCIAGVRKRDQQIGETTWFAERMERAASVVTRRPDGVVRSWERVIDLPGTCREGGYRSNGWAIPLRLGLTKSQQAAILTV